MNRFLLHAEGFFILMISIYFYDQNQYSWFLFFILLFAPDISILGYLINKKVGAVFYNVFHTYSVPIAVILFSLIFANSLFVSIGLIWTAHIGMDRLFGFGLKYTTDFKDTHLNRI
ncbi:hypothetical protein GCM10010978_18070 [Compostibacillus humi]|uniref:DUF4260 family protein n=1 Tax=Compostibacillus humi TaxID=1245525 RepID=A0A8J2TK31_9BACI|nr:DUF4260 domain-containing protein [Compostibacillus humi]GFZ76758.1 hypothetical protein GCM10010978_18070 [Compostibacillus humi]HLT56270.1 DUF4260 domain-containing protein [Bacillota bacterium]